MFLDAHCHLEPGTWERSTEEILERAAEAGVSQLIVVGCGLEASERAVALAQQWPGRLFAATGVHPHDAAAMSEAEFERFRELALEEVVVGVGEVGLDYHYDHSPRDKQRAVFGRFLELAKEVGKPIVIHTREAEADTLALLEEHGPFPAGGQLHCYTGTAELALPAVERFDFHVSFSGVITFNNAEALRALALRVPKHRLLVETDSPYLCPAPFRGQKNEPAFVTVVAGKLAELLEEPVEVTARRCAENTRRLFSLPLAPPTALLAFASGRTLHLCVTRGGVSADALREAAERLPRKKLRALAVYRGVGTDRPELYEAVQAMARDWSLPLAE